MTTETKPQVLPEVKAIAPVAVYSDKQRLYHKMREYNITNDLYNFFEDQELIERRQRYRSELIQNLDF